MGSLSWISPEIASGMSYSKEVDIWSFGCFAYELATGYPPFMSLSDKPEKLLQSILNKPIKRIPNKYSNEFADFVSRCLKKDRDQRYTIEMLMAHEFL